MEIEERRRIDLACAAFLSYQNPKLKKFGILKMTTPSGQEIILPDLPVPEPVPDDPECKIMDRLMTELEKDFLSTCKCLYSWV